MQAIMTEMKKTVVFIVLLPTWEVHVLIFCEKTSLYHKNEGGKDEDCMTGGGA